MANGDQQWFDANILFSLSNSNVLPDFRSTSSQRKARGQPCSATGKSTVGPVYSWPPSSRNGSVVLKPRRHGSENDILLCSDARESPRSAMSRLSSFPLSNSRLSTTTQGKFERVSQPIRARSNSLPLVRCPPGNLWAATPAVDESAVAPELARLDYGPLDDAPSPSPIFPPGLSPYPPGLKRRGSDTDLHSPGSASSFLASGSQPIQAYEQMNPVAPIGAERSRVLRMIASRPIEAKSEPPTASNVITTDPSAYFWYPPLLSPKLQSKLQNILRCGSEPPADVPPCEPQFYTPPLSGVEFDRLLRQTTNNRFTSRIISPLSPLRSPAPSFTLTTDPVYQARMPSFTNMPSLRYSTSPIKRSRT